MFLHNKVRASGDDVKLRECKRGSRGRGEKSGQVHNADVRKGTNTCGKQSRERKGGRKGERRERGGEERGGKGGKAGGEVGGGRV